MELYAFTTTARLVTHPASAGADARACTQDEYMGCDAKKNAIITNGKCTAEIYNDYANCVAKIG